MFAKRHPKALLLVLLGIAAPLLAACGASNIEAPFYDTTDVAGFKSYAAPSNIMVMEVHDGQTGIDDASWAKMFSHHGFAPQLSFITPQEAQTRLDSTNATPDHPALRPKHRMVVVVNPTQNTSRDAMCTDPQNAAVTLSQAQTPVRFAFCSGDSVISELRANIETPIDRKKLADLAPTVIHYLFPISQPDRNDDHCSRLSPGC
ncbi:hypothetical protein [Thalassospira mesophila]|uniref:DUF4136 domain-containing protein n=1 Tax=Thalassospira mesophila TaxID=1293891 RepID=A0A1Y2L3E4_9PROT|nr:hypothetical protein [Thalassospira mesophila]OSQ38813.1 hypothetical protein TMES_08510 [Thalassospira mesophila]